MEILKFLIKFLFIQIKNTRFHLVNPQRTKFLLKNIPYFSQWESRNLIGKIIRGEIKAAEDPKWKNSGAKSLLEYSVWSWNGCGLACLKSILAFKLKIDVSLVNLGKECMRYGGYKENKEAIQTEDFRNALEGL